MMLEPIDQSLSQVKALAEQVLALAKKCGADAADVDIDFDNGVSVSARAGKLQSLEYSNEQSLSLTVYKDQASGTVSTTDLSQQQLHILVSKAIDLASYAQQDEYAGLLEKSYLAFDYPNLDLYHPWDINHAAAIDTVKTMDAVAGDADHRIIHTESCELDTSQTLALYANTHGFMGYCQYSRHGLSCSVIAKDGQGKHNAYDYTSGCCLPQLQSAQALARQVATDACAQLGARKIKTQTTAVIFNADIARSLWAELLRAVSGSALYRRSSFLLDTLGKTVAADRVNIYQRPHQQKILASSPFDAEGGITHDFDIVNGGVLQSYILSGYAARKLKMAPTGNAGGVYNIYVDHHDLNFQQLLAQMDTGLLVTDLMGSGANIVNGDYSRGASGFWVEKGEIQYPVHEITLSGNLAEMLKDVVAIASDVDHRGNIKTGSVLIQKMVVAGS